MIGIVKVAETIAAELDGEVIEIPVADGRSEVAVALADGRVPVVVRDFGHVIGVVVEGSKSWSLSEGLADGVLADIVATARTWARSRPREHASMVASAIELAAALAEGLGQRWTVGLPGVTDPREAWLHGPEFDAGAVGVVGGRALVAVGGEQREFSMRSRAELAAAGAGVIAAVREQLAKYAENVAISRAITARAEGLADALGERLGGPCKAAIWFRPSHWRASEVRILDGSGRLLARVFERGGDVRVHAGLEGEDGWDGRGEAGELEAIVAAIERERGTLTIERLVPGARYRVLKKLGELREGTVVRLVGFDDIDNHYGVYRFTGPDGRELGVPGDYSTPRRSPLGAAYRYLEAVDDDG